MIDLSTKPASIEPAPFQIEDMKHLKDRVWSCNWSEMGCYKTSTVLWLVPQWAEKHGVENPKVLIVTTRSGKGTYFKHVPDLLPDYDMFNLTVSECRLMMEGHGFPMEYNPKYPGKAVYVAHYNVFSRRKKRKSKIERELDNLKKELKKLPKEEVARTTEIEERIAVLEAEIAKKEAPQEEPEGDPAISMEDQLLAEILGEIEKPKKEAPKPLIDLLLRTKWDIVILDEAHRIKERRTGWTREIKRLKSRVKHVMTGTGFINNPAEIWSLLHFCSKSEFASYWHFREKYCAEDLVNGFRKIVGINPETKEEFQNLVRIVGPRRTKREVFKNLPEPIYTPYTVELNPTQRKMYEQIRDELFTLDQEGIPLYAPGVLAALQRLRQICVATPMVTADYYDPVLERRVQKIKLVEPSSKLDALMDILDGLEWDEERKDQVVVFSNFKDPLELLKVRLDEADISYMELRQADNDQTRYEKWAIEFPKKNHQVFMSTVQLGSESISLTSASTCVFLDRSWSPKDNNQAESRVWRPGQEEVANIIHINAEYTVDNRIFKTNELKTGWFKEIFG